MYGPELNKGTVVANRYTLKEYKGSGSFGEVWLAEDNELGLDVAIKLYISLDQKGQDEFKEEYKVAYGLSHENLLTAQYYSVWNHRPFLIMKYCSRGSASNLGGAASENEIWKFIHDVANGLKYLHAQEPPIVHQDIKPENILIDEQNNFLITDFGISKKMRTTMRKQSKRSIESGAIAYMGPERFLKDPMAVKASDIWSLGVSIYEMATNDLPFMGQGGGMLNAGAALPELDEKWSRNLNISTDADSWTTWGIPSFCEVTNKTATSFTLKCNPNNTGSERSDYMKVKTGNHEVRIDIKQPSGSGAKINRIWVDHNTFNGGQKGMMIHIDFEVNGLKNHTINPVAYFYYSNGNRLNDYDGYYRTTDGQVSIGDISNADYEGTQWKDFKLFMPYNQLHMGTGSYDLKFQIEIHDKTAGKSLLQSDYQGFTFSR